MGNSLETDESLIQMDSFFVNADKTENDAVM